jgi:hypothetical protein
MGIAETISKMSSTKKMNAVGLLLTIVSAIPLWVGLGMPFPISFTTQGFYDAIYKLPKGSVVAVGWQAVKFEQYKGLETSAAAVWKAMHSRGLKVICLSMGGLASLFFEDIYKRFKLVELYGLVYGEDYVITPFIAGEETALASFARDTWATVSNDIYGNAISSLPLMQRVRNYDAVSLGIMSSYSFTNYDQYIRQWGYAFNKPLIQAFHGFTPIAYAYPWPVVGALDGDRGNAEFEYMTGFRGEAAARFEAMATYGMTYVILFVGVLAGNLFIRTRKHEVVKG